MLRPVVIKKTYPDVPLAVLALATIPMSSSGWTDFDQIRLVGEQWLRNRAARPRPHDHPGRRQARVP
ncbi:MAG: hypothetical protein LC776_01635 [Acidobacteria bacterium]|nr:hypothetical protein [Acidobacteriota bacterium]